ncbi:dipeptide/oligopeptide/nickel ABC transporter permease/ATP-binding protein [uncultured Phycicoccus sp.]|uniref:dipeptide/oligopeptide/nickel ABC transporter permease/ATP-binding protein n=1 Tax=uncultured Phycicoccus sp. TaxID=661422 RepID=UPI0026168162|nr:dipeptide/oligopeptide/nickel ABC transporter permease/ATP-binding protein [uncultured Phycicoccus sp.]
MPVAAPAPGPVRRSLFGLLVRNPLALTGLVVLVVLVLVAIFAGVLAPSDPIQPNLRMRNAPPGTPGAPLGGDGAGRDILSRLMYGTRLTLTGAALAILVAAVVGVPAGLVAGYRGRLFDAVASWVADVLLSVPGKVILLAVIAAFGPSVLITMSAFGVILSPHLYRLVRTQTIGVKNELYVDAATVAGLSDVRIVARHILSVVRAPIIIQSAILAGIAVIVQSGLEFLGLGDPSQVTWGSMLGNAFAVIYQAPTAMIWPGVAIGVTVASLVLLGNGLRDAVQGSTTAPRRPRRVRPTAASHAAASAASATGPDAASEALLDVRGLRVGYPRPDGDTTVVVDGVDLRLRRGEVLGLVGESGSGKTQTAFAVLGLLPRGGEVLGGSVVVNGEDIAGLSPAARRQLLRTTLAYVPQEPMSNLDPAFRVGQQLVEPLRVRGMARTAAKAKALDLLAEVGIPDPRRTFDSYPHQISGGMAQRVLIAGAISADPVLLIADEPTTALDVTVQAEVLSLLRRLQRERDMGVLLVTHNLGVVADICDTVAVMRSGRVVETAPVAELFANPQHEYTRALLDASLDDTEPRPALVPREHGAPDPRDAAGDRPSGPAAPDAPQPSTSRSVR